MIPREAHIGRLVAACLHEGIAELLPERLEFYEVWLKSQGLRDGTIGFGPMTAVLGFLRTEAEYPQVMARAGRLAAEWSLASLPQLRRSLLTVLPVPRRWRVRAALRAVVAMVRHVCSTSRTSTRIGPNTARLEVHESLFCSVRDVPKAPLCEFYLALATETLHMFGVPNRGHIESCHAIQGGPCVLVFDLTGGDAATHPATDTP